MPGEGGSERLHKKIVAVAPNETCPFCENTYWYNLDEPDQESRLEFKDTYISTYALACSNCGFVRQHVRAVIDEGGKKKGQK